MDFDIDQLLDAIAFVESSNNPNAINSKTGARGLFQFMPIGWKDVVENYPSKYGGYADFEKHSLNPEISRDFAKALIELNTKRLKGNATIKNILASYNWGIGNVLEGGKMPLETRQYIQKVKSRLPKGHYR